MQKIVLKGWYGTQRERERERECTCFVLQNKRAFQALDTAEMCISNYCKSLGGQERNHCEFALEEFRIRRHEAETQCTLSEDPITHTYSCQELEQMEDMARQVWSST